ncbi:MAG: DnaJ domain-containing protein [Chloroflexota bacterium]|nr:DnaJ domain-containing protein [Chloroflexota bacterium]
MTTHATPTITLRYDGGVDLRFPYCAGPIADLKASIPAASRTYDPDTKTWSVSSGWAPTARRLMARHFPEVGYTSSPPPPRPAPPRALDAAYQALYVRPEAPACVVEAAYRALSRLYHPDRKPPAERDHAHEQMIALNQAMDTLRALQEVA